MATYKPGQIGDFNGKIGQVVLSKWRTVNVGRSAPKKSTKKPSGLQVEHRAKFKLVTEFIGRLGEVIAIGYQSYRGKITPGNAAVQYHLKESVIGVYPDYELDYKKIALSTGKGKGEIMSGYVPLAVALKGRMVEITWGISDIPAGNTKPTDQAVILFYNATQDYFFQGSSVRSKLKETIDLSFFEVGDQIHTYLFFVSKDGKFVSLTSYLKMITLID